jgi:thymidylate synthase ThyX
MIDMVIREPAMPVFWGKNVSGMQSKEELTGQELLMAKDSWLRARDRAVESARELLRCGLHKQHVNRVIENFMYVKAIVSGTEFENFFALRAHPDAQPEIQALAYKMLDEYNKSEPKKLLEGEWHVPFSDNITIERLMTELNRENGNMTTDEARRKISVARCARVSYLNFEGKDDYNADIKLCDRLFGSTPKHLSPTEHVARCENHTNFIGNFRGFTQMRKTFVDENLKDARIIKK